MRRMPRNAIRSRPAANTSLPISARLLLAHLHYDKVELDA